MKPERICKENLVEAGKLLKTHGLNGELVLSILDDALFEAEELFVEVDGLPVPFFVESRRPKSDSTDIVRFFDVNTQQQAQPLAGQIVYLTREQCTGSQQLNCSLLCGYKLYNNNVQVGVIEGVDDQTANVLFIVRGNQAVFQVPVVDEWILSLDRNEQSIFMSFPDELLHINEK